MRGLCWVHIKYIYYYEQYTHTPWLTLPNLRRGRIEPEGVWEAGFV